MRRAPRETRLAGPLRGPGLRGAVVSTLFLPLCALLVGCAANEPANPSFAVTEHEAYDALGQMRDNPVKLQRPVVVVDGWMNPGMASQHVAREIRRYTGDRRPQQVLAVSFLGLDSFEQCRARLIERVAAAHPGDAPGWTGAVDVVGFSMGGLVARYAALPAGEVNEEDGDGPSPQHGPAVRLRIARLITISTPHRGATLADMLPFDALARHMRQDAAFIHRLNAALPDAGYTIHPYVRLDDGIVGARRAAPPDQNPWWVPNPFLGDAHNGAHKDLRILADILRRLRGEPTFSDTPAAPVPGDAGE